MTSVLSDISGPKGSMPRIGSILVRSGVLTPSLPHRTLGQLVALRRWGPTVAGGYRAAAARSPRRVAVIDENRSVTFRDIHRRAVQLANGLESMGAAPATRVAVLCRNHAWLVETVIACAELGADVVLLSTGLSVRQTVEVLRYHRPSVVVADAEFAGHVAAARLSAPCVTAWPGIGGQEQSAPAKSAVTVEGVIAGASDRKRRPPAREGRLVVLTSGTTGAAKGASRRNPPGLGAAASLLSRIPLRACDTVLVATPLFHMWGLAALQIGMALRHTLVLQRTFEPKAALQTIADRRCSVVFGVPVILQRLLELPPDLRDSFDTSSLRIVATSGAAIPAPVVTEFMDTFGDLIYSFYGSTEVSWASVAGPDDLRVAPSTAGRPPLDTRLRILDLRTGELAERGATGRIFVSNSMLFEGYTNGSSKETRNGYMSTGDLGHLDSSGRLYVHGRDADMIHCLGERMFPRDVEDLLAMFPEVREAVVVGVSDADFGQRFAAYVVVRPGAELSATDVRVYIQRYLPSGWVPRDVVFVDALPRNSTGKVVVRDLPPSLAGG